MSRWWRKSLDHDFDAVMAAVGIERGDRVRAVFREDDPDGRSALAYL